MSCRLHRAVGRKIVKTAFDSWKTKLLLAVGVETIGPTISSDWCKHRPPEDFCNFEPVLTDFDADEELCPFCLIGSSDFKGIMSVKDDSGVSSNSTTPAVSPRVDVLNNLCSGQETINPEVMQNIMYQQAMQMEMYHNMQMMMQLHMPQGGGHPMLPQAVPLPHLGPIAPHLPLSAEMQKMIMDGQIPYPNPAAIAQQQYVWHQMMMAHMHRMQLLHKEAAEKQKQEQTLKLLKEERPLDLSRKSGLEIILEIENAHAKKNELAHQAVEENSTPYDSDEGTQPESTKTRAPKRNYTQIDLEAAINDIRNGKLGTRRASVVYGIPRSTLRNKIYKLEAADELGGITQPYKRKRKEVIKETEKPADEQIDQDKGSSDSPSDESSNNSTDLNISDQTETSVPPGEETESPPKLASIQETIEAVRLNTATGWPASIWATLFSANGSQERQSRKYDPRKDSDDWKKSRPKRGQYRKYDKNALDEAVQSVRRGEMSVHRAGSFYGVPHSTLEYKVKERNLLRKKKCDATGKPVEEMPPGAVDLALRSLQEVLSN